MTTLALFNVKGGVGKSTAATNLAFTAARDGSRTLLWDLDAQGAASYYMRIDPALEGGYMRLLDDPQRVSDALVRTEHDNLDLIPADPSITKLTMALAGERNPIERLAALVEPVASQYDHVFFDCSPGISPLSDALFGMVDMVVVPTIPTTLSMRALAQLFDHLDQKESYRPAVVPFLSMVDRRRRLHREIARDVSTDRDFLAAWVPYASPVERMAVQQGPIGSFARGNPCARAYELLWTEIEGRLTGEHASTVVPVNRGDRSSSPTVGAAALAAAPHRENDDPSF